MGPYPWTAEFYARQELRDLGLDLAAGKTFGQFGIQANLKNVLDKKSFLSNGGGIVFYDTPRAIGATLTYRF